jgi:hypothetical protein
MTQCVLLAEPDAPLFCFRSLQVAVSQVSGNNQRWGLQNNEWIQADAWSKSESLRELNPQSDAVPVIF